MPANHDKDEPGRGLAETGQAKIEERALELAHEAGRQTMNEYDLATARDEILGPSDAAVGEPGDADVGDGDEVPDAETPGGTLPS